MSITKTRLSIEPLTDPAILSALLQRRWGDTLMMFGRIWKAGDYSAIAGYDSARNIVGLATYAFQKTTMLALTIDNFSSRRGIGSALLGEAARIGREHGARTLRVVTTNDNTPTLRYFQKRGFRIVAFYPGAVVVYRTVAPNLPEVGVDGIPVRDAIELEIDI